MAQKASMGRIVIYKHPGSLDGKFPPRESPAIIQEVLDEHTGLCRLFVFGPKGQHMDEVPFGDGVIITLCVVAQLDRAVVCEATGHTFESCPHN